MNQQFKIDIDPETVCQAIVRAYGLQLTGRNQEVINPDEVKAIISRVGKWLTGLYKPGLMLFGGVGSGKTTLAKSICETIAAIHTSNLKSEEKQVRQCTATSLTNICKNRPDIFQEMKDSELLFIDDIGIEPVSIKDYGNDITPIMDVICHRYDKRMWTLITTNLTISDISDKYGIRIADRVIEMFDRIGFDNPSYRK